MVESDVIAFGQMRCGDKMVFLNKDDLSLSRFDNLFNLSQLTMRGKAVSPSDDGVSNLQGGVTSAIEFDFEYKRTVDQLVEMGGVSIADFDNDGDDDVFFPNNIGEPNHLYVNENGQFREQAFEYGIGDPKSASSSALFGDYDNDGDRDLFVFTHTSDLTTPQNAYKLFENTGESHGFKFIDVSEAIEPPVSTFSWDTSQGWHGGSALGDYNDDGFLDFFSVYWNTDSTQNKWRLYKSIEDPMDETRRKFVDATYEAGLMIHRDYDIEAWQPNFFDLNFDGYPDLHIAIDFTNDFLFLNNGDGTFTDVSEQTSINGSPPEGRFEMGKGIGDIDNDGDLDIHLTNMNNMDRFYRNDWDGNLLTFTDIAPQTHTQSSPWGWGDILFDLDNDSDLDIATVSGRITLQMEFDTFFENKLYINQSPASNDNEYPAFLDVSDQVHEFSKIHTTKGDFAKGLAAFDYDSDGDLDIITSKSDEPAELFENTLDNETNWIRIDLIGKNGSRATEGAKVWVGGGGKSLYKEIITGSSFLTQEPSTLHFGYGNNKPSWIVIEWPDGTIQTEPLTQTNTRIEVEYNNSYRPGDINNDGMVNVQDEYFLLLGVENPALLSQRFPNVPGVLADIDRNNLVDMCDAYQFSKL